MAIYANSEKNLAGTDRNNIVSARRISGRRPRFTILKEEKKGKHGSKSGSKILKVLIEKRY